MRKKYHVTLKEEETQKLKKIVSNGNAPAKHHKIAHALLMLSEPKGATDEEIGSLTGFCGRTIAHIRKKYAEGGMDKVFEKKYTPRISRRKFDGEKEAHLIALCCSKAPEGRSSWSIRLLADKVVELNIVDSVSRETIRQTLKKTRSNRGKR